MSMSSKLLEKIRSKRKDIQAKTGQREDMLRVPVGKHKFRILPAHPSKGEEAEFWADFGQHFIKSDEKNERGNYKVKAVYVCVDKTFGKHCDLCSSIEGLMPQATDDLQIELLEESKCNRAEVLVNCLHLTGDKPTVPQILQLTPTTFEFILGMIDEYGDITNLTEGVDLIIERSGAGLNTKYAVMPAAKSAAVSASVLEQMTDLQDFVQQEHEENLTRAISALNSTVGLIDYAPKAVGSSGTKAIGKTSTASTPKGASAAAPSSSISDDDLMSIMEAEFEELEEKAVVGSDVAPAAKSEPEASAPADDMDDMDTLLADLENL
ncbi:hypothetical protein ACROAI_15350 [Shewanella glacialipiscicola]